MGRIFISHQNNPADNAWAAKVHAWIKDQKSIRGFLDFDVEDGIKAGEEWEKKIYASMNAAQVVIAIVSKDWLESSWCMSEARMARLLGRKLILIITEKCEVPFRATQSIRLEKHGEDRAFEELRQALQTTHNPPARPYPGLATFAQEDAAVFFGREDETKKLENQLESLFEGRPETERLLLLLGASGSGKSSLMRAGLLPGFEERKTHHAIRPIIPRGDPLGELAVALGTGPLGPGTTDDAARTVLDKIAEHAPGCERILLPIDQAEELLRGDHSRFFDVLKVVLERGNGRIIALMTMRSDFLNAFQQSGLIGTGTPLLYDTYTLDPLPQERLPDIIQKPAEIFTVTFEEGLVARIMEDHGGPDALPLLAFFLSEFWTPRYIKDGRLEIPEYEHSGGIDGALKGAVDEAIKRCAKVMPEETDARKLSHELREIFLGHLVAVSAGSGDPVRRRAATDTLTGRQVALLKEFARKRLLIERDGTWEVTHEALLRQWEDLKIWIDAAREDLVAINRIEAAAAHWDDADRREEDLTHSGSRLSEARGLLTNPRYADRLDETARLYLTACQQKETELYEKEKQLREDAQRERDRAREGESRARRFAGLAAMVALVALVASGFAYLQWGEARQRTAEALKNQRLGLAALASNEARVGRAADAVHLALAAWPRRLDAADDLSEYRVALDALAAAAGRQREIARWAGHEGGIFSVAFSPDGTRLATAGEDGTARLWDVETGAQVGAPLTVPEGGVAGVAFSPDGRRLATAGSDSTARLWDVKTGAQVGAPMTGHEGAVFSIAFSPDGTRLATAGWDGTARLWDVETGTQVGAPMTGREGFVSSVAFSPDGTRLATAGEDGKARLWNVETGTQVGAPLTGHENWVLGVAFSPDGTRLATASADFTARLWDVETGAQVGAPLTGHEGRVASVVFSPDGTRLATAGYDGTARLWDVEKGAQVGAPLTGHEGIDGNSVAFSPDGRRLATAGWEGTARLWDLETGAQVGVPLTGHEGGVASVAFSPDGTRLATAGYDGTARLWDVEKGAQVGPPMTGHEGSVVSVAFSPDGTRLATGSLDNTARLWDIASGAEVARLEGHENSVWSVAFSTDGKLLATVGSQAPPATVGGNAMAGGDGTARLWDVETGAQVGVPLTGHEGGIISVAFSPDGTRLVTAGEDGTARLWDIEKGTQVGAPLTIREFGFLSVAFSPNGRRLATDGDDGTAKLWDLETGAQVGAPLTGHRGEVISIAFSPDGTRLATTGWDGAARLWDLTIGTEIGWLEGHEGGVLSVAFSPDGTRLATAGADGTARLWNIGYGPGNAFEVACRRLPTRDPPAILETYGIVLDEPVCSGEEPLPFQTDGTP